MYPRNAASPERISIGPVIQISDGAVQTAGVTVRILPFGGTEADGVGTVAYSTDGVAVYTPTQGETNYTSFVLIAKKTGCIPADKTVVTSESTVSGRVYVQTNGDKTGYTATVSDKTGFSLLAGTGLGNQTANITGNLTGSVGSVTGSVGSVTSPVSVSDKTGFKLASDGLALVTAWTVGITGNLTGNVTGSVGSISGVTFPANFEDLGIDPSGSILVVDTVMELGANALTANNAGDPIADIVWDEVLTGATHNIASSAGRRLRQLASVIVRAGTAQGPGTGNNQIQLDAGASSTNGEYDPGLIFIETGTGAGQARLILQYNGSTKVATVDRDWRINPDNTSEFVILADAGRNSVNEGLAQGGTSTTITLNASASATDDAYNGQLVFIRSGTGQDQVGLVEDYVGSTKVATIRTRSATGQWETVPDTTSAYMMIPNLTFTLSEISGAVAATQALSRLDSMIESDGAGQFRFDTIALENAPAGGGGGGTDWTANERTAIRSILGIPTSGTTPADPTVGILDEIRDKTALIQAGGTVNVSTPVTASGQLASPLIIGDDYLNANGRAFSWTVALPSGFVAATATCKFGMRYEDDEGVNSFIQSGTVIDAGSGNVTLRFDVAKAVTGLLRPGWYDWSVEIASASGTEITRVKSGKNAEWQEKQT
jgi:hypothetical protein